MKKDKDWLSEQVGDLNSTNAIFNESGISYIDTAVSIERVFDLIDQLDEPEVLSQELPVIPKYVAEWIEEKRESYKSSFLSIGYELYANNISEPEINFWMTMNQNTFARAWLDGFTVEEEPLYYIVDKNDEVLWFRDHEGVPRLSGTTLRSVLKSESKQRYQFTEQEIKDYDERYLAFKVPVEVAEECYKEQTDSK